MISGNGPVSKVTYLIDLKLFEDLLPIKRRKNSYLNEEAEPPCNLSSSIYNTRNIPLQRLPPKILGRRFQKHITRKLVGRYRCFISTFKVLLPQFQLCKLP